MPGPRVTDASSPASFARIPILHRNLEFLGEINVAPKKHFDRRTDAHSDRAAYAGRDSINHVLRHVGRLGGNGKADCSLLHERRRAGKLLLLLHSLNINCGVTVSVSLGGRSVRYRYAG